LLSESPNQKGETQRSVSVVFQRQKRESKKRGEERGLVWLCQGSGNIRPTGTERERESERRDKTPPVTPQKGKAASIVKEETACLPACLPGMRERLQTKRQREKERGDQITLILLPRNDI